MSVCLSLTLTLISASNFLLDRRCGEIDGDILKITEPRNDDTDMEDGCVVRFFLRL